MAQIKYNLGNLGKEVYSTDETAIGTWIDGKTIYRKCIVNNGSFSEPVALPVDLSNVDRIIEFHGTGIFSSLYEFNINFSNGYSHGSSYRFGVYRYLTDNTLNLIFETDQAPQSLTKVFIFMDYTKKTE